MENNISAIATATPTENAIQTTQVTDGRRARMEKYLNKSEQFSKDTDRKVSLEPNIPVTVLFFEDWYNDYDELMDDALKNMKLTTLDASEYAQKNYKVKQRTETGQESKEEYALTTYKVTLPNTTYPNMVRDLDISSKKARAMIEDELKRICVDGGHTGKVLMTINKKMGGKSRFDVKWEIKGTPA